jgi:hypothetical protein
MYPASRSRAAKDLLVSVRLARAVSGKMQGKSARQAVGVGAVLVIQRVRLSGVGSLYRAPGDCVVFASLLGNDTVLTYLS